MKHLIVSILLCVAAAACGDDGGTPSDACTGHACGGTGAKITDPDGGNILFEYIYFDTELQAALGVPATVNRVMAYFMSAHTPDNTTLPTPGVCNNLVATQGWPMHVGMTRTDLDVGALTITGKNKAGADVMINVPKMPMGTDGIGRPHTTFYQAILPNADDYLKFDSSYTVKFGGAGDIPATTFDNALFLAADFSVNMPMLEGNGPMQAGQPFNVKWTPATSANLPPAAEIVGGGVLGVTWLVDSNGSPTHMCPVEHGAGDFTIPGQAITEYRPRRQPGQGDPAAQRDRAQARRAARHADARAPHRHGDRELLGAAHGRHAVALTAPSARRASRPARSACSSPRPRS
jgi:hypothetical protein